MHDTQLRKSALNVLIQKYRTFNSRILQEHLSKEYKININQSQVCRYIKQLQKEIDPQIDHMARDGILRTAINELIDIDDEITHIKGMIINPDNTPQDVATLHKTLNELRARREHIHHNAILMPKILHIEPRTLDISSLQTPPALTKE